MPDTVVVLIVPPLGRGARVAPPATVIAVSSSDEPAANASVPALTVVGPVYWDCPVKTQVPVPFLVSEVLIPPPDGSWIEGAKLLAAVLLPCSVSEP